MTFPPNSMSNSVHNIFNGPGQSHRHFLRPLSMGNNNKMNLLLDMHSSYFPPGGQNRFVRFSVSFREAFFDQVQTYENLLSNFHSKVGVQHVRSELKPNQNFFPSSYQTETESKLLKKGKTVLKQTRYFLLYKVGVPQAPGSLLYCTLLSRKRAS